MGSQSIAGHQTNICLYLQPKLADPSGNPPGYGGTGKTLHKQYYELRTDPGTMDLFSYSPLHHAAMVTVMRTVLVKVQDSAEDCNSNSFFYMDPCYQKGRDG